jgi:hypothetical protein
MKEKENFDFKKKTVIFGLDLAVRVTGKWLALVNTEMNIRVQYNA